jgi:uncharacterized protein YecT (DUF1311 family)
MKTMMWGLILSLGLSVSVFAQSQLDMNDDAIRAYEKADKELNLVYKQVIGTMSELDKTTLKTDQRKWIKIKESSCKKEAAEYEGGSMYDMIYYDCLARKTKKRITELKKMLNGR